MINRLLQEWHWIEDLLAFYFWIIGVPYLMQWLAVDLLS